MIVGMRQELRGPLGFGPKVRAALYVIILPLIGMTWHEGTGAQIGKDDRFFVWARRPTSTIDSDPALGQRIAGVISCVNPVP